MAKYIPIIHSRIYMYIIFIVVVSFATLHTQMELRLIVLCGVVRCGLIIFENEASYLNAREPKGGWAECLYTRRLKEHLS